MVQHENLDVPKKNTILGGGGCPKVLVVNDYKMSFFVETLPEVQFLALQVHWDPISERSHNKNGHGEIFGRSQLKQ